MSYSFSVKAPTKAVASEEVVKKFDEVVTSQPVHAGDRDQALAGVAAVLALVRDAADGEEVRVSVNGYLSWSGASEDKIFTGASIGATVSVGPPIT